MGVRIECIGMIVNLSDPTRNSTFLTLWKDVEPPGQLIEDSDYEFEFQQCEKPFETYEGSLVKVRYFIRVVINRAYQKIAKEQEFVVQNVEEEPEDLCPKKLMIG